ncbi:DUF4287 domain-containing protein [Agromyces sp. MMS24-JH15]|uniref:DUF4287 domain-containing protein n=1 Tax=Agromyces sp. MMS24-JH15 TaxID=3243765 RepID=UPI00374A5553
MGERGSVAGSGRVVGEEAVVAATGRPRDEWFAVLDAADATTWRHRDVAAWLVVEHGVEPWWAQHLTVGYEQSRGIRRPGQRQDGTWEVSVSRTVPLEKVAALRALAEVVERETGVAPLAINDTAKHPTARFPLEGREFVLATATEVSAGRASLTLTRGRMPDGDVLEAAKAELRGWLAVAAGPAGGA